MKILTVTCLVALVASPALAQNSGLTANFGDARLRSGFTPDPYRVSVTAGGDIDAHDLGHSCAGSISDAPDFELTYSAGSLPLIFRTLSSTDTTLVINAPDGSWHCDDDSYGDGDAEVRFNRPESGVYDVWVGTYGGGHAQGSLLITETP